MTIDGRASFDRSLRSLAGAVVLTVAMAGCGSTMRRPDGLDVATLPEDVRHSYAIFEVRCSRCHTLARPLNADIDDPQYWEDYVRRMRRQPGSGISRADASDILRFLHYYTAERLRREREEDGEPATPAAETTRGSSAVPPAAPAPDETASDPPSGATTPTPGAPTPPQSTPSTGSAP